MRQTVAKEEFTLFYGGVFSQWLYAPFVIDGVAYNCAEQYMMAQKARLFKDKAMLEAIMGAKDPSAQKAFGKKVKGFKKPVWEAVARDVVMRGSLAKFTSTSRLRDLLLDTEGTVLVEASPTDVIWGIGLAERDPAALDREQWQGSNWLGQVLTDLREHLLKA